MDAKQFDFLFNRYAYIQLTLDAVPQLNLPMVIFVPIHAFEPALNIRTLKLETNPKKDCTIQRGGGIDHVSAQANHITIEGWAPWKGEEAEQELRVISARSLRAGPLSTVRRPDISETMKDYIYTRAGFKLELSSTDGRPVNADEVVLVARGTSQGIAQLSGCGCP